MRMSPDEEMKLCNSWSVMAADAGGGRKLSGGPDASFQNSHHHWSVLHCGWCASKGRGCNYQRSEWACRYLATRALEGRVGEIIDMRTFIQVLHNPKTKLFLPLSDGTEWRLILTTGSLPQPGTIEGESSHRRKIKKNKLKSLVLFCCYCVSNSQRSSQQSTKCHRSGAHQYGDALSGKDGVINQYSMKRSTRDTETRCMLQIWTEATNGSVFFPSQVLSLFPVCNG